MAQVSCGSGISVSGTCLGGGGGGGGTITGTGLDTRVAVWSSATNITYRGVVIDSSSNLDMSSAGAGHIFMSNETMSLDSSAVQSPSADVDVSFVNITDNTTCTGTLADGTTTGQTHMIALSSVGGVAATYDLTVTNFQPPNVVAGTYILRFTQAGQSANLIWDSNAWIIINSGATVV